MGFDDQILFTMEACLNSNYPVPAEPALRLPRLLKVEEVAQITNISPSHLYALISEGVLPAVQFGRARRIRPADLEAFIEAKLTVNAQD